MKDKTALFMVTGIIFGFITLVCTVCAKMFEYSLFVFFGKDVPWYYDCLGGIVLNTANFPIWVFSLIAENCTTTPLFP